MPVYREYQLLLFVVSEVSTAGDVYRRHFIFDDRLCYGPYFTPSE